MSICFLCRRSTVKSASRYSFQFNERARPARLKPVAFCLKGRCSIQLCYEQTREGSVMSRSPQDKWIGAPLGGRFSNLHCALTVSRDGCFPVICRGNSVIQPSRAAYVQ